jgi:hypothetical protein
MGFQWWENRVAAPCAFLWPHPVARSYFRCTPLAWVAAKTTPLETVRRVLDLAQKALSGLGGSGEALGPSLAVIREALGVASGGGAKGAGAQKRAK